MVYKYLALRDIRELSVINNGTGKTGTSWQNINVKMISIHLNHPPTKVLIK
jgi:hypothetical protein